MPTLLKFDRPGVGSTTQVGLLRHRHIWRAASAYDRAFRNDPLHVYLTVSAGVTNTPLSIFRKRFLAVVGLLVWMRTQLVLTVDDGATVVTAEVPSKESSGLRIRFLNWFYNTLSHWVRKLTYTNEALKRRAECDTKMKPVIADKLGDRAKDMIYIPLIVTEPESQGRGYSKALLSTVTNIADSRGLASWLFSSNIRNEGFYNKCGFVAAGSFALGDGNPTWDKDPIVVQLMIREPKTA
ncbi:hypothetical protein DFP72DRAFT_1070408 [Ephemerocybe angulata]|uniref:N-acetyltransferase domain-containing protein n=1 Tax=Ephemerocybe angulata TaxID=980116 RepID=A0A8H6M5T4_9AGAR|nr:hypothetical protein DFP72DRAFT_1070408 [Tulosesus angulatus]